MKAAVITAYGGPEVVQYQDYPDPMPGPGEVLVKVAGAGINPIDIIERSGGLRKSWMQLTFPAVIGWDVSGTVAARGAGVTDLAVGDRVCAWAYHTYAELCAANATLFAKVPDDMDLADAAALPLVGTTGSQLVSVASGVKPGQTILVSGANGGVGRSAVYTAKTLGATVIAGVTKRQLDQATSIGADQTVALDDEKAFAAIPQVDVVANALRGKPASQLMAKVKPGGTFASATGAPDNAKDYPAVRVVAFVSKQDRNDLAAIVQAARAGKLRIPIDRRIPLRDAANGMAAVETGHVNGKVILVA
jgi:NADPH:quinone reductase-like Zn-dependent oxidoreductase